MNDETMQRLREEIKQIRSNNQSLNSLLQPQAIDAILQTLAAEIERAEVGALNKLRQQLWDIDEPGTNAAIGMIDKQIKELHNLKPEVTMQRVIKQLIAKWRICRKQGHQYYKDGETLGGDWIRCANCNRLDEYLPGLHEPKGYKLHRQNILKREDGANK
jgi:hypothetical protein